MELCGSNVYDVGWSIALKIEFCEEPARLKQCLMSDA